MPTDEPNELEAQDPIVGTVSRRNVLRRGFGFAIAAPAVLTLLQACGGDDDDDEPTEEPAADETEPAAEETEPAAEETEPAGAETPAGEGTPVDIDATTGDGGAPSSDPLPEPPDLGS